ncbi:McrC family protein [Piscibacillus salipiscarius]|uniref:McrC family protein n=1 Tax=Piscibacillus salipiscarius TaxID=299480 RepID=UPI0034E21E36
MFISNVNNESRCQISRQDAEYLKRIEINQGKQIFKWGSNYITPQHWVGIISTPNITIEILPKIADSDNKAIVKDSLIKMLKVANDIPLRKNIDANVSYGGQGFIDVLASIFLKELEKQIQSGLVGSYSKVKKNLPTVKGSIDFSNHIKKNTVLKNKFYCRYSKFTNNNIINQTIKYTLHFFKKVSKSTKNISLISKLYPHFDGVELKTINISDIDTINWDRQSIRYKIILDYCKLFILGESIQMSAGKVKVDLMLFDMNKLFERFIFKMYKRIYKKVSYQYGSQYLLTKTETGHKKINLRPDIILNISSARLIIDTKWKQVHRFADESDIYQMNSYLNSFPNITNAILLYPKTYNNDKWLGNISLIINKVLYD